jgi:hypothetical protein
MYISDETQTPGEKTMSDINIGVVNESSVISDALIQKYVAAVNTQANRDFARFWGYGGNLSFFPKNAAFPKGYWQVVILDTSDQAGALGYHDYTSEGQPIGKIFAKSDLDSGSSVSVTLSHEVLEMLGDPGINLSAMLDTGSSQKLYAYETCDAVEADELGYKIGGIQVSDFVTPAWFEPYPGMKYSFMGRVKAPFTLAPGGYISVLDLQNPGQGWQQITAQKTPKKYDHRAKVGSRRERRRTPRHMWMCSVKK